MAAQSNTAGSDLLAVDLGDDGAIRARLASAHVALIGCGGLGSNAAMMLVRAGVGELTLVDYDVVDQSNLNRQMFFPDQIGQSKTAALAETLVRLDPGLTLHLHQVEATEGNLVELVGDAQVVIEAADGAEAKAMVANTLLTLRPGLPLVAASGLAGAGSANEVVTAEMAAGFYIVGDQESDVRGAMPLISSRVMVAAAHEAHMAIRILLGHAQP